MKVVLVVVGVVGSILGALFSLKENYRRKAEKYCVLPPRRRH